MVLKRTLLKFAGAAAGFVLAIILLWQARNSDWVQQVVHHFPWYSGKTPADARRTRVKAEIDNILKIAEMMQTVDGRFPTTLDEMVQSPADASAERAAAFLDKRPLDPWGHEYLYALVDGVPEVTCLGSDGARGGDGEAEDVMQRLVEAPASDGSSPRTPGRP